MVEFAGASIGPSQRVTRAELSQCGPPALAIRHDRRQESPELIRMIPVLDVAELVRDDVVDQRKRRHHDAPVDADVVRRIAASPALGGTRDEELAEGDSEAFGPNLGARHEPGTGSRPIPTLNRLSDCALAIAHRDGRGDDHFQPATAQLATWLPGPRVGDAQAILAAKIGQAFAIDELMRML